MKEALVIFEKSLKAAGVPYKFLLNVHDEWQLEVPTEYAETVKQMGVECIKKAGEVLKLRCPLSGEGKVGQSWLDTH